MKNLIKPYLATALCMMLSVSATQAQDRSIKKDYPLTKVSNNVYVIFGPNEDATKENQAFRNNVIIITTSKGVVVVDPGSSKYIGEMVVNKVKTLTSDTIVAVFNTHGHGDHWLGNDGIRKHFPNAPIYGHDEMITDILGGDGERWIKAMNQRTEGAIEGTVAVAPSKPVKDGETVKFGNISLKIYVMGKTHSHTDIMLEIPEENVLIAGDVLRIRNLSPFMSSFKGNLNALDMIEKMNAKVYVPGHGPGGDKSIINEPRQFINNLKSEVKKHYEQGLSDFEMKPKVIKALAKYKNWSGFDEYIGRLINLAYLEVESESF